MTSSDQTELPEGAQAEVAGRVGLSLEGDLDGRGLPFALAATVDAVVCLGAVIRGETSHYDFVAGECAAGLQRVQLDTGMPVVFGVLTTENVEQALARSLPDSSNKGRESAQTAVEMARLVRSGPLVGSGGPAGRRASAMI